MKALKWIGIGFAALTALVGVIVVIVFTLTGGATDAANAFLTLVGKGRYEAAYKSTAPQFQAQQAFASFRATMQRFGLDKYKSASWPSRKISGGLTTLTGTIETRDGGKIPANVILIQVNDAWRVYSMGMRRAGSAGGNALGGSRNAREPDFAGKKQLALRSLLKFNEAIQKRDFSAFHATLATPLRRKYSPQQLRKAFQSYIDKNIDLAPIRSAQPQFGKETSFQPSGRLRLKGFYPTRPSQVQFTLSYLWEGNAWRLIAINVRIKPVK